MPSEINPETENPEMDDPRDFAQEDPQEDQQEQQDHLSDIKDDIVNDIGLNDDTRPDSNGEKSDSSNHKNDKKPMSLYPEGLSANLFSHTLFNSHAGLASMSPYYAAAVQNLSPFSSLYANHDLGKEGLLHGVGSLPHPFNPWANPYASAGFGGLRYPFPGLRPQLPTSLPFQNHQAAAHKMQDDKRIEMERKKKEKNSKPHIKKPLNAFMLYMKEQRAKVVSECTLKESAAINQILGRKWHALNKEEQQKYYEMARKEREKHMVLYPGWSARDNYGKRKKSKFEQTNNGVIEDYTNNDGGSAKKCRAVYGLEAQHLWCAPCRRKKKCVRYPEGGDYQGNENSLLGQNSPLALAHGMLQGSPLSPQFNQNSPTGFMPPSPFSHDHNALMAAHLQNLQNPGLGLGMIPRPNFPHFGSPFNSMINSGKISPNEHAMGRHTPHSDGSAGSGSAGNGPTLNGTIEVKLEETDDQLSPCVSPEPVQPMKRQRLDQSIAT